MQTISAPRVDIGHVFIPEGVIWLLRLGRRIFLFLVIIALVITFPLPEPDRDWHDPEGQPSVETAVSGPSQVVHITVSATPNYHGSN